MAAHFPDTCTQSFSFTHSSQYHFLLRVNKRTHCARPNGPAGVPIWSHVDIRIKKKHDKSYRMSRRLLIINQPRRGLIVSKCSYQVVGGLDPRGQVLKRKEPESNTTSSWLRPNPHPPCAPMWGRHPFFGCAHILLVMKQIYRAAKDSSIYRGTTGRMKMIYDPMALPFPDGLIGICHAAYDGWLEEERKKHTVTRRLRSQRYFLIHTAAESTCTASQIRRVQQPYQSRINPCYGVKLSLQVANEDANGSKISNPNPSLQNLLTTRPAFAV